MIFGRRRNRFEIPAAIDDPLTALLCEILLDSTLASLDALERAGAIELRRFRTAYAGPGSAHYELLLRPARYRAHYAAPALADSIWRGHRLSLVDLMSAACNHSIGELEDRRIVDTRKLRAGYRGVGSHYYDRVTEQIWAAEGRGLRRIVAFSGAPGGGPDAAVNRSGTPAP